MSVNFHWRVGAGTNASLSPLEFSLNGISGVKSGSDPSGSDRIRGDEGAGEPSEALASAYGMPAYALGTPRLTDRTAAPALGKAEDMTRCGERARARANTRERTSQGGIGQALTGADGRW